MTEPDLDRIVEDLAAALDSLDLHIAARRLQNRPVARLILKMRQAIHEYRLAERTKPGNRTRSND